MGAAEIDQAGFVDVHAAGARVVDVREPHEYEAGHVPGAVNIPVGELAGRAGELADGEPVYLVCQGGGRSSRATAALRKTGVVAVNVAGGTKGWQDGGRPTTPGPTP